MWRERLTEFSDCLQLGLLVCAASIPVVTVGPAFAAGCRVVSRWRDGESPPMFATFRDEFVRRLRGGVPFSAAVVVAILLLSVDLALVGAGVPGGQFFAVLFPVMLVALLVVALRTCSVVAVHQKWIPALRAAARLSLDIRGSALLAGAIVTAGVLVWMQPLMLLLVAGPVTLAAVGTAR
ncbi:YesL family protein [Kibdelosporangium aridum]|uniref:YesL family protein n=1 Tax=Kibdelosporangium aridum TaxID=2030 RepID=UPI0005244AFE